MADEHTEMEQASSEICEELSVVSQEIHALRLPPSRWVWLSAASDEAFYSSVLGVMVDASQVVAVHLRDHVDEVVGYMLEVHTRGGGVIELQWTGTLTNERVEHIRTRHAEVCALLGLPAPRGAQGSEIKAP